MGNRALDLPSLLAIGGLLLAAGLRYHLGAHPGFWVLPPISSVPPLGPGAPPLLTVPSSAYGVNLAALSLLCLRPSSRGVNLVE